MTYTGLITKLAPNEVFVFGSNLDGFHGAGSAGYASFGVVGNYWRKFDYDKKPNGWRGKWNVKGINEGMQEGTEGKSYALPTVIRAGLKRSRFRAEIEKSIQKLYTFAAQHSELLFFIAQQNKKGLSGYSPKEMAQMFACAPIPANIIFEDDFYKLVLNYLNRED